MPESTDEGLDRARRAYFGDATTEEIIWELWRRVDSIPGRQIWMDMPAGFPQALLEMVREYGRAVARFRAFPSPHHGLATIEEEFLELREEVFWGGRDKSLSMEVGPRYQRMYDEAKQLAAMGLRFMVDACGGIATGGGEREDG